MHNVIRIQHNHSTPYSFILDVNENVYDNYIVARFLFSYCLYPFIVQSHFLVRMESNLKSKMLIRLTAICIKPKVNT